jgi:hypothetical protein
MPDANRTPSAYGTTSYLQAIASGQVSIIDLISATGHPEIVEQMGIVQGLTEKALVKASLMETQYATVKRELEITESEREKLYDLLELILRIMQQDHPQAAEIFHLATKSSIDQFYSRQKHHPHSTVKQQICETCETSI